MKLILGAVLLLLVGCGGALPAQGEDTDAQIAALSERVADLEDRLSLAKEMLQECIEDGRGRQQRTALRQALRQAQDNAQDPATDALR